MVEDHTKNHEETEPVFKRTDNENLDTAGSVNDEQSNTGAAEREISIEENTIETLKQQLESLKAKADKNMDLAVRAKAELENVRKRAAQDVSSAHKYALEKFVSELFPLLDALEQGLNTVPKEQQFTSVIEGMTLCLKMFEDVLVKFGVEGINPNAEADRSTQFDPAMHEAILMQPAEGVANGSILKVVQKGYALNKRVLRPARVIVAKS